MGKTYLIAIYVAYLTATTVTEEQKSIFVSADAKTGLLVEPETPGKREDREKRSDDGGPLEVVVMQQAESDRPKNAVPARQSLEHQRFNVRQVGQIAVSKWNYHRLHWCPSGTTEQYHGYLSVGNYGSASASEFLCLDANPDDRVGSDANENGAWFDHTATVCGSLPCPPYVNGKAVMCVSLL